MTNQESIECTCEVDCQVEPCCGLTSHKIIHGPCHSPGPEGKALGQWLAYIHSQAAATDGRYGSKGRRLREIERTAAEFMEHLENGTLGDDYYRYADTLRQERDTLLARNEELEQALRERSIQLHTAYRIKGMEGDLLAHDSRWQNCTDEIFCIPDRTLINGEEK